MRTKHTSSNTTGKAIGLFALSLTVLVVLGVGLNGLLGDEDTPVVETAVVTPPTPVPTPEPAMAEVTLENPESDPEDVRPTPLTGDVSYADAEAAFQDGDYEESARLFTVYTEQHPGNAWGHYMLGLAAWKSGQAEAGETAFRTALDLDPDHQKSRLNLTRLLLEGGRYRNALVEAETAVEQSPQSGEAHRLLARAYHNMGDGPRAEAAYRAALVRNGKDVWALNGLGLLLIERERFGDAVAPLARASQIQPDVVFIQNNLGIALERFGHFSQAADAYRAALEADDTNEKALVNLDRVLRMPEDPSETTLDLAALADRFQPMVAMRAEVDSTGEVKVETAELSGVEP